MNIPCQAEVRKNPACKQYFRFVSHISIETFVKLVVIIVTENPQNTEIFTSRKDALSYLMLLSYRENSDPCLCRGIEHRQAECCTHGQ